MFENLTGRLSEAARSLSGKGRITEGNIKDTLRFASGMAKDGNWREAQYRWQLVLDRQPDNPRVLNNLAVAAEALGVGF